jgi:hypothetical protein
MVSEVSVHIWLSLLLSVLCQGRNIMVKGTAEENFSSHNTQGGQRDQGNRDKIHPSKAQPQ